MSHHGTRSTPRRSGSGVTSPELVERDGGVADVVATMLFLCSADAGFITGETVKVAGGAAIAF